MSGARTQPACKGTSDRHTRRLPWAVHTIHSLCSSTCQVHHPAWPLHDGHSMAHFNCIFRVDNTQTFVQFGILFMFERSGMLHDTCSHAWRLSGACPCLA